MTPAEKHIEDLQLRLSEIAKKEQLLISALNQALSHADRKLLDDVRGVTLEHEARRAVILTELQSLAARIGAFPVSEEPLQQLEGESLDLPYYAPPDEPVEAEEPARGADWRQAAENISDELDFLLNGSAGDDVPYYPLKTGT